MTDPITNLKTCLGHVRAGTDNTVSIVQDDATMSWIVSVGTKHVRTYEGRTLEAALAAAAEEEDPDYG